jgi:hypothetical protein
LNAGWVGIAVRSYTFVPQQTAHVYSPEYHLVTYTRIKSSKYLNESLKGFFISVSTKQRTFFEVPTSTVRETRTWKVLGLTSEQNSVDKSGHVSNIDAELLVLRIS